MNQPDEILRAAELIRAGRLVAFPTETVYGLGANALDPQAVARIFAAKRRPRTSPLIVHVSSVEMARRVAAEWPETAARLAAEFWPGPLTMVLPKRSWIPDIVTAGLPTVGIRIPRHPVALGLIEAAGVPIAAPSANRFTELSPTSERHVARSLGEEVDLVLAGGFSEVGIESTVILLTGAPAMLRPGVITREQIEKVIGPLVFQHSVDGEAHHAPGMHPRHYCPRTPLVITNLVPTGNAVWVWWRRQGGAAQAIQMPSDPAAYAAALYRTLHEVDESNWDLIAVEPVPEKPEWAAIRDRLMRAASEKR